MYDCFTSVSSQPPFIGRRRRTRRDEKSNGTGVNILEKVKARAIDRGQLERDRLARWAGEGRDAVAVTRCDSRLAEIGHDLGSIFKGRGLCGDTAQEGEVDGAGAGEREARGHQF